MKPFIYAISGYKNTGKTTMITRLLPLLKAKGFRVAVIKHDGHDFRPDVPGTDTDRHRLAGAYGTAIYSDNRLMITREVEHASISERDLFQAFPEADIILIEGLKASPYPKYICKYPEENHMDYQQLADHIAELAREDYPT